jgi:hypothetical protein
LLAGKIAEPIPQPFVVFKVMKPKLLLKPTTAYFASGESAMASIPVMEAELEKETSQDKNGTVT